MGTIEADYVVVGAGAVGMAFTDALIDHADVRVVIVDRRHAPGGRWLEAYPFVRLHQASAFYGVASTLLGDGRPQERGPERGLHERATAPEICAYFGRVMAARLLASTKVSFPRLRVGGRRPVRVPGVGGAVRGDRHSARRRRGVPRPRDPGRGPATLRRQRRCPGRPGQRPGQGRRPSQYVVVGAGKTATDACVWLLGQGVDPDAICWVRFREPWMLNRAVIKPDPAIFVGAAADIMEVTSTVGSADDLFLGLEDREVVLRIDRSLTPTMAKTPTLAQWELDLPRTVQNVVRLGYVRAVERGRLVFASGAVQVADDALVVHCAASRLQYPPLVPIWEPGTITLHPIRAGFPCFGAALAGFVEATVGTNEQKNRLCPPTPHSNTPADWLVMQVLGSRASASFTRTAEIRSWADTVALNPVRAPDDATDHAAYGSARDRVRVDRAGARADGRARGHGVATAWSRYVVDSPERR